MEGLMTFDPNWPHGHVTRDGRKARIICTDLRDGQGRTRLVAVLECDAERHAGEVVQRYFPDGTLSDPNFGGQTASDLLNAPAPKRKIRVKYRFAVSECGQPRDIAWDAGSMYGSYQMYPADGPTFAIIEIDREVEEGEGL